MFGLIAIFDERQLGLAILSHSRHSHHSHHACPGHSKFWWFAPIEVIKKSQKARFFTLALNWGNDAFSHVFTYLDPRR